MFVPDQIIVTLWFLPEVFFIVLPLVVSCIGILCKMFAAFNPVAGQAGSRVTTTF